jgi:tetratricopeptide (TPR) repeat protein
MRNKVKSCFAFFIVLVCCSFPLAGQDADPELKRMMAFVLAKYRENPEDPGANADLGSVMILMGKFEDGSTLLKKAVRLDPKNQDFQFLLGRSLIGAEKFAEAIPVLQELLKEHPRPESQQYKLPIALQMLADAHYKRGEVDVALGILGKAVEADPHDPNGYFLMGILFLELNQVENAQQTANSLRTLDPKQAAELDDLISQHQ